MIIEDSHVFLKSILIILLQTHKWFSRKKKKITIQSFWNFKFYKKKKVERIKQETL